jgi:hypothetical protein|tara:strand:- start:1237 stop:1863 length:627 start_codon:yes stop_codon:yes gene_type:complete
MAINSFVTLKTAVANWLDRDDLDARIPEFIAINEAVFNRVLRIRPMETIVTAATVGGTKSYDLPTGYVQMREIHLDTSPITSLQYLTPEMLYRVWAGSTSGKPNAYSIIGNQIYFGETPDGAYDYVMTYYKTFDGLSDAAPTNWVILNAPDVYLYGTLLQAEPFLMNDQRISVWERGLRQAISDLQEQNDKDRHSGSELRVMNTSGYF